MEGVMQTRRLVRTLPLPQPDPPLPFLRWFTPPKRMASAGNH
jgi:hypothetical protein